jgi:tetratricopeptide (TPR) repeat protein
MAASECFARAARLDPKSLVWPYYLGYAYQALYDDAKAAAAYEQCISIDPNYAPALVSLAGVIREKDPIRAAALCRQSIGMNSGDPRAYLFLGQLANKAGHRSEAIRLLRQAVDIAPHYGQAHEALAEILNTSGTHNEAEIQRRAAKSGQLSPLVNDPVIVDLLSRNRNANYLVNLARRLLAANDYDAALRVLHRAVEVSPKNQTAQEQIGMVLAMSGRLQEAADHFRSILTANRSSTQTQTHLAGVLVDMGKYDEAVVTYNDVLSYRVDDPEALEPAGLLFLAMGRPQDAAPLLEKLAAIKTNDASAQMHFVAALICQKDFEKAVSGYQFAQGLMKNADETLPTFLFELLRILALQKKVAAKDATQLTYSDLSGLADRFSTKRMEREAKALKKPLSTAVDIVLAWAGRGESRRAMTALDSIMPLAERGQISMAKGSIAAMQQRYPEAEHWFSEAVKSDPSSGSAKSNLGAALLAMRRYDEAVTQFREVLKNDPNDANALMNLGMALSALNRLDDAEQTYKNMQNIKGGEAKGLDGLGDVALRRGKVEDALSHLEKAASLAPQDGGILVHLGAVLVRAGRFADAIQRLQKATEDPHVNTDALAGAYVDASTGLAAAARSRRDYAQVERVLRDGLAHAPESAVLANALAWTLATCPDDKFRKADEAIQWASTACQLTNHQHAGCQDTLAAAYGEAGKFDEAVAAEQRAIRLAKATKGGENEVALYERHLQLYKSKKPIRDAD